MTATPRTPGSGTQPEQGNAHIRIDAPAKINLYLEVVGRRDDGFHELVTVLQTIDLADGIDITARTRDPSVPVGVADVAFQLVADGGRDDSDPATIPTGADNLAVRAAVDWLTAAGQLDRVGIDLGLEKHIPAGAGLGGGSSDAAAVLLGLDRLLGHSTGPELAPLAAALGSDVAFFLVGGTALCTGRGEQVMPLAEPDPFDLVLGFPDFPVPTPAVYRALDANSTTANSPAATRDLATAWSSRLAGATVSDLADLYRNDLESAACRVRSELVDLLSPPDIHLSGSGSTLFLYGSAPPADTSACRRASMRFVRHRSRKR